MGELRDPGRDGLLAGGEVLARVPRLLVAAVHPAVLLVDVGRARVGNEKPVVLASSQPLVLGLHVDAQAELLGRPHHVRLIDGALVLLDLEFEILDAEA